MASERDHDSDVVEIVDPADPSSSGIHGDLSAGDHTAMHAEAAVSATPSDLALMEFRAPAANMFDPTLQQHLSEQHDMGQLSSPAQDVLWHGDTYVSTTTDSSHDASYGSTDMTREPSPLAGMSEWDPSNVELQELMGTAHHAYAGGYDTLGLDHFYE